MFGSNDDKKAPQGGEKKGLFGWWRKKPQAGEQPADQPVEPVSETAAAEQRAPADDVAQSLTEQPGRQQPSAAEPAEPPAPVAEAAERMLELASRQPGYLGVESVRGADGFGITVSYWDSEAAIRAWSRHAEHRDAQARGRRDWYAGFSARIARVEREYAFPAQPDTAQSPASS